MFSLISIGLAFFVIAASPGPANIANATIAMSQGRKVSLIYGAGLSTGLVFWGIIAASGLGVILQSSIYLLMALKLFGGLYLLRLAYLSAKDAMQPEPESLLVSTDTETSLGWFIKGVILNISNPKTVIAWMAALSVGLGTNNSSTSLLLGVFVCIVVGFATNALYSIVFSFGGVMAWYQNARQMISGLVSGLFTLAGFGLIRSAFSRSTES